MNISFKPWSFLINSTRRLRRAVAYCIYRWPEAASDSDSESGAMISYSAFGEDRVAFAWLCNAGIKPADIRYLDVGASDPIVLSNTMLMYSRRGHGVLVEPDLSAAQKLRLRRMRDTVVDAAVAFDEKRWGELILFNSSAFNTFSEEQAKHVATSSVSWDERKFVTGRIKVRLIPINDIIDRYLGGTAPHFLSIDAESVDFEILQSLDFDRFRPWIICVEKSRSPSEFSALLMPHGYRVICETPHNLMFARDPWPPSQTRAPAGARS